MNSNGKISSQLFNTTIYPNLGKLHSDVLVGPKAGVDAGIVSVSDELALSVTTDPFFVMPELGWKRAVWFAIHILVSDSATTALTPKWITLDLNLPVDISDNDFAEMWEQIHLTCLDLNLSIVTGHTGRYDGSAFPIIGCGTVLGIGSNEKYITTQMAQVGDKVLLTKSAALETTAMFGAVCHHKVSRDCGTDIADSAKDLFGLLSVVKDAELCTRIGVRDQGVTTMHDATERGVQGALIEVAEASEVGMMIHREEIHVLDCTKKICQQYQLNPYSASSEGTLLITCRSNRYLELLQRMESEEINCKIIGEVVPKSEGIQWMIDGRLTPLEMPESDPFWDALVKLMKQDD